MIRLAYNNLAQYTGLGDPRAETRLWVEAHIPGLLCRIRRDRRTLEDRWLKFWKIWNVELDAQSYSGRSKTYLSAGRNALETWVIGLMQGLFPMSEWFDVMAVHGIGSEGAARAWKACQRDFLNNRMKIKLQMPTFLRQYVTFGTAFAEQVWDEEYVKTRFWEQCSRDAADTDPIDPTMRLIFDEPAESADEQLDDSLMLNLPKDVGRIRLVERDMPVRIGPTWKPLDIFRCFVHPMTAEDLQSATAFFHDMETTVDELLRLSKVPMDYTRDELGNVFEGVDEIEQCGGHLDTDQLRTRQERTQKWWDGNVDPNTAYKDLGKGHINLTKLYWRGEIPDATDPDTGEEYGVIDWAITMVNDTWCVRLHPNPFYSKRRPYREARLFRVVDEYYGRGITEPMASLQYMLNDIGNLTIDNIITALNPIILINEDLVTNMESLRLAPNAKWFVDPQGVQFVNPPNVAQIGMATMNMMQGFIQDSSMASFIMQGQAAPRGRGRAQNTASGLNMLLQQNAGAFQFVLSELEEQLMIPTLEWNYELASQFMTDKLVLTTTGTAGIPLVEEPIGFEDIFGKYLYVWRGAQGVREQMTLTSQMQNFMQLAIQIRQADPTAQFQVKWPSVLKAFITKGMGLPDAESWIITPEDNPPVPPDLALKLIKAHRPVDVTPADDHIASIQYFLQQVQQDPALQADPMAMRLLENLITQHVNAIQQMVMQAQQAAAQQAAQAAGPPGQGSMAAPGGPGTSGAGPPAPTDLLADAARAQAGAQSAPMGALGVPGGM